MSVYNFTKQVCQQYFYVYRWRRIDELLSILNSIRNLHQKTFSNASFRYSHVRSFTTSADHDIIEAFKQSNSDIDRAKGANSAAVKVDQTLKINQLKADRVTKDWSSSPPLNSKRVGKTINVDPSKGKDIGRSFQILSALVSRDRIKVDYNKQKFYERTGIKRKRVRCERWRKKFKAGFVGTITRVQSLKNMGWWNLLSTMYVKIQVFLKFNLKGNCWKGR